MIPYMGLRHRIVAWLLWKLNGWSDPEKCRLECIEHPDMSITASLLRDYWYVRKAREAERGQ